MLHTVRMHAAQLPVRAVVWDFDNTLVDSREKNLAVTRRIVAHLKGTWEGIPMLSSLERYEEALWRTRNWRDLYRSELGMDEAMVDAAGSLWTGYQITETTAAPILPGIPEALDALRHLPHAIFSANSRRNIDETLNGHRLRDRFVTIVGYEEVHLRAQKPAPDGFLLCVRNLGLIDAGVILYVGDHEVDAECATNANLELDRRGMPFRVLSVGADYGRCEGSEWSLEPDYRAGSPDAVVRLAESLNRCSW
ncbi:MAG: HAD-IA family hydrolase [Gemmatimonadales bacterium]